MRAKKSGAGFGPAVPAGLIVEYIARTCGAGDASLDDLEVEQGGRACAKPAFGHDSFVPRLLGDGTNGLYFALQNWVGLEEFSKGDACLKCLS